MASVYIKTYGCQMNERDSEAVAAQLVARGHTLVRSESMADVILLNTCSVRDAAERKALNKMETLTRQLRRGRPHVVFGFMGCMAQSHGQKLIDRLPEVDLVLGTQKFHRATEYLDELLGGHREKIVDVAAEAGSQAAIREHLLDGTGLGRAVTAYVSIMQGCNQYCTFCIVPHTRGLERSRSIEDIVDEVHSLVQHGVREITLLGQIVTNYGRREIPTRHGKSPFVQLLEAVDAIEGLDRIRFTAPHPKGYGDDLVEAYGRISKLCPSAHVPVQSGSNSVLQRMHRGYTRERFVKLIRKLRQTRADIGITTDLIVGFPGETEDEFEETLDLARQIEFDQAYVFRYSPRHDTPAANLTGQVPSAIKEDRNRRLLDLINEIGRCRYERYVGRRVQVLVEGPSRKNPARFEGRTPTNKIVVFDRNAGRVGQLINLRIIRTGSFTLYGDCAMEDSN